MQLDELGEYAERRGWIMHRCIRQRGQRMVELPASVSTKVLLINEMLLQPVRPAELTKRLDIPRQHVNRLLDPRHATKIDGIAAALKVLGKTLEIRESRRMPSCPHKHMRSTILVLEPNHEQSLLSAVATLQCHLCGQPFKFAGILEAQK
jgi:hypothetical protein